MKIENLKEGMIVKSYRELCRILEIKEYSGGSNSKNAQMKEFGRHVRYEQEKYKFIIHEIYDEPLPKKDGRGMNPNSHSNQNKQVFKRLSVPEEHHDSIGVYRMVLWNNVYVGSTVVGFRERFMRHRQDSKYGNTATSPMLKYDETRFEIIEVCKGLSEPEIRERENYWIQHYASLPEWKLLNTNPAWSQTTRNKKPKTKYKSIRVDEKEFDKIIGFMEEEGIEYRLAESKNKRKRSDIY